VPDAEPPAPADEDAAADSGEPRVDDRPPPEAAAVAADELPTMALSAPSRLESWISDRRAIRLLGAGLLLAPLSYLVQAQIAWRGGLGPIAEVAGRLGLVNLIGILVAPIVGLLALRLRPPGWYAVVGYALYTVAANAHTYFATHRAAERFVASSIVGVACMFVFLRRDVRREFFAGRAAAPLAEALGLRRS
jgi:hypothetical protein